MDIRKEYEKICPMTTWSDEQLINYLHKQEVSHLNESTDSSIEVIKVNSIEEYMKENNCKYAEDIINDFRGKLKCD